MLKKLGCIGLILFLAGWPGPTNDRLLFGQPEISSLEESVLCSPALQKGNYDTLVNEWLEVIKNNPDKPIVEFIVRALPSFHSYLKDRTSLIHPLEEIFKKDIKNGFNKTLLMDYLRKLYLLQGRWEKNRDILGQSGFISRWAFNGPWGSTNLSAFDDTWWPETEMTALSFEKSYPALSRQNKTISWRLFPLPVQEPEINFFSYLPSDQSGRGVVYGISQINLPAEREVIIRIITSAPFKLWLNHQPIFEADRLRKYLPVEITLKCTLQSGWNRLMIKLASGLGGDFSVQLLNADGFPLTDFTGESELKLHPVADTGRSALEGKEKNKPFKEFQPAGAIKFYTESAQNNPDNPFILMLLGLLHFFTDNEDEAVFFCEKAVALKQDSAYLHYFFSQVYNRISLLPEAYRRNQVKKEYEKMLNIDSSFMPAYQGRAIYYNEDDKTEEALQELERAFKINPGFFYGYYLAAKFSERQGWVHESEQWMQKLNELAPDNLFYLSYRLRRCLKGQNYQKALELTRKMMAQDYYSAIDRMAEIYKNQGDFKNTLEIYNELMQLEPANSAGLEEIAELYIAMEDYHAAVKIYRQLSGLVPESPEYYQALGDAYLKSGDRVQAVQNYQKSVALKPANINLHRYLIFLNNESGSGEEDAATAESRPNRDDFYQSFAVDVKTLIPGSPAPRKYPKAAVVYLLDQAVLRIYPDGSHSDVIHQAYKILNDEGIEKYSQVNIQGELLEARIYQPDGTVLEPVQGVGSSFTMPDVQIGSVIEYKFKYDAAYASPVQFNYPAFYFQDPNFDSPFLISQFIVVAPKDFDLKYIRKNLLPEPQVQEKDGTRIYNWTMTHTEQVETEPLMPHYDELLPHVRITQYLNWHEINKIYKEYFFRRAMLTRSIKDKARELVKDGRTVKDQTEVLYYFVTNLIKETSGNNGTAQEILVSQKGNRLILLKALLDAVGIENYFALTRQNSSLFPEPDWSLPQPDYFTAEGSGGTLLQVVQENGEFIWLSGVYRYLKCGLIPSHLQGGWAFVIDKHGGQMIKIPQLSSEENLSYSELTFQIDEKNEAAAVGLIVLNGENGANTKESLAPLDQPTRKNIIESSFNPLYPGFILKGVDFSGLQEAVYPLTIKVEFTWPDFVTVEPDKTECKTGLVPLNLTRQFISESERKLPLEIKQSLTGREKVRLILPPGLRLKEIPESVNIISQFGTFALKVSSDVTAGDNSLREEIIITKNYFIPPQTIAPPDYKEFIEFCRRIDNVEKRKLLLEPVQ